MPKRKKPEAQSFMLEELVDQNPQLELFRTTEGVYTNAFEFYENIPRFVVGGTRSSYIDKNGDIQRIKWNPDGTALPIEKLFKHQETFYDMRLTPALVKQADGTFKAMFPGVREEIIEFVIFKLAVEQAYFYGGTKGSNKNTDNFTLTTSIYAIQQELKKRNQDKTVSYNTSQIKEALEVLKKIDIDLENKNKSKDDDSDFIPHLDVSSSVSEWGFLPEKKRSQNSNRKLTIWIRLGSFVSKSILAKDWRRINYEQIMLDKNYLGRWFRRYLSIKFTYAFPGRDFNFLLSTVINLSGISPYSAISDNEKYVKKILNSLDIIEEVQIERKYVVNPKTKRKVLKDTLFIIFPTKKFGDEQIRANQHHKRLDEAVFDDEGKPILEPQIQDFSNSSEYRRALNAYEKKRDEQEQNE